jgi:hypothetical protein
MATLERIQPYVEQLFDDSDVQKQLSRAATQLRGARSRAAGAKSKKQALKDPRLRHRLVEGGRAALAAAVAIQKGPEKQKRRSRRGRLLALAVLGAAGFVAANADARERVLELVGANNSEATT